MKLRSQLRTARRRLSIITVITDRAISSRNSAGRVEFMEHVYDCKEDDERVNGAAPFGSNKKAKNGRRLFLLVLKQYDSIFPLTHGTERKND